MSDSSHHLDKLHLLSCLFEGDSGRVSPNSVVSFNIRKHGGDVFSTAVRQYGFPYKWVQSLCGISVLVAEGGGGGEGGVVSVQPKAEVGVENMASVMAALRKRFKAQVNLARQIATLGKRYGEEKNCWTITLIHNNVVIHARTYTNRGRSDWEGGGSCFGSVTACPLEISQSG